MNKVILTGNLARDPEVRYTQTGKAVVGFTIAVSRGWKNKTDNQQPTADFFSVTAWDKLAEFCGKYLTKGSRILLEGRLQARSYEAQDGTKRNVVEIVANEIEFAGGKRQDNNEGSYSGGSGYSHSGYSNDMPRSSDSSFNDGDDMIGSGNSRDKGGDIDIPF